MQIIFGKYRHILRKVKLKFKNLPKSFKEYKNREYDKLAQILRENVDIEKVYEIMGMEQKTK